MSGAKLNDVELTILSLVAEGARYGVEIERLIEGRGLREWLIVGSASFYYILSLLEQQGLITGTTKPGAALDPEQTVFQITDAGRGVVQTAVADLLCQPRSLAENFAVGLANISALKPQQAYHALLQHHEALTHRLEMAEMLWARHQSEDSSSESTEALYSHGIAMMRAELGWLTEFMEAWHARHPVVERDESKDTDEGTQTPLHRRTVSADKGKQIQRIKRPKVE